nr:hypothetical protein [Tanacetum cinerariifolium]
MKGRKQQLFYSISISPVTEFFVAEVPTGSGSIPTVGPPGTGVPTGGVPTGSDVVPTASFIFTTATVATPYTIRKGKEKMVESETPKKKKIQEQMDVQMARQLEEQIAREDQRMFEQIARDAEIARIHAEEELQVMIDGLDMCNEMIAKHLNDYEQAAAELTIREKIELINELVKYQDHHCKILQYQAQQRKPRSKKQKRDYYMAIEDFIPIGSKEEAKMLKRKGLRSEQESVKKLKTSEQAPEEMRSSEDVPEESLKEMMQLVPVEEVYVKSLQVKHPIIDWEIHTEGQRSYWKITRLGGSTSSYQFFVDMLKHFDREDLNQLWALVKESLSIRPASIEWKLYDTCGVHHVTFKDQEIFMLVEKDYPMRKGLAIVMICYKLQGRIVGNKMHKAFPLLVKTSHCQKKFPLLVKKVPPAEGKRYHCCEVRTATEVKE